MPHPTPAMAGLTLLELLIVLTLVSVVLVSGVPLWAHLSRELAVSAAANQMVGALHLARSAGIRHNVPTVVCLRAEDGGCLEQAGLPARGWLVFHDHQQSVPVRLDAQDELIRVVTLPEHVHVLGTRSAVTYWPAAGAGTTSTFTLCPAKAATPGRAVIVSQLGRPRVSQTPATCAP